jgi:hypothetical protein
LFVNLVRRKLGIWLLPPFLSALGGGPALGAPPGYFIDGGQLSAPLPSMRDEAYGTFTLSIRRDYSDSLTARLLRVAESLYPPRDSLVSLALAHGYEMGADSADVPLWWCDGVTIDRVPFAVTARAVAHYIRLTELFGEGHFRDAGVRPLFSSKLTYRATIAPPGSFHASGDHTYRNAYVARLHLTWTYDDGTFVPVIDAYRTVALDSTGNVLAVSADGAAREKASMSSRRGIGRQQFPPPR